MIISGGARSNWRFFAKHLTRADENEVVRVAEMRGLVAGTVLDALREMDAVAMGTRAKSFFYHADINPREDEHLTEEQWEKAVDALEASLGLEGHPRFVVEHFKHNRTHRHVVWSRVDTETMTVVPVENNYECHERTSRQLEDAFGLEPTPGVYRDGKRAERRPDNWEVFRGHRSGIDPKDVKAELTALWHQSDTGQAFAAALAERGYILAKGDRRDFVVIDQAGDDHSLSRRIDGVRAAEVRARMADIDRDALPTVEEARAMARDRNAQRKDRDDPEAAQPEPSPLPVNPSSTQHQPSPMGELAEEVLHAVKNGFGKKEQLVAELAADAGKPGALESIAGELARVAKESGPLAGGIVLAAAAAEGGHLAHEYGRQPNSEPARERQAYEPPLTDLSLFDRVGRQWTSSCREAAGDGLFIPESIDWLAGKIRHLFSSAPAANRGRTPFDEVAEEMTQATRENGGEPCTADGQSFWQRSVALITESVRQAVEQAATWVRSKFETFAGRLLQSRSEAREHEQPDRER